MGHYLNKATSLDKERQPEGLRRALQGREALSTRSLLNNSNMLAGEGHTQGHLLLHKVHTTVYFLAVYRRVNYVDI